MLDMMSFCIGVTNTAFQCLRGVSTCVTSSYCNQAAITNTEEDWGGSVRTRVEERRKGRER